ncbi:MAG: thioredoxin [Alphaproteobacteria bacterium]|nr:thioredoxin [Alphaproteobacteria bacterium]
MALIGPGGRPVTSQPAQNAATGTSPHIKDSGLATFAADVLEQSRSVPVIVDFWAPWCGPCKTLGPALEAAVDAAAGAVKLVKVNIDENPEIAQQLRIQSIPTVYAFKNGQPVDGFMGAIPESQIKAFVTALADGGAGHDHGHDHDGHDHHHHGGPEHTAEVLAVGAEALAAGDFAMAAQAYGHVLQDEPGHPEAVAGLARAYLLGGEVDQAKAVLQMVKPDAAQHDTIRAVEAELKLRELPVPESGETANLRAKLAADPKDHQARYHLAMALDAAGDRDGAIAELLELIRRDRAWNEDAGRKQLVTLFEAMGFTDPRTIEARRKLSGILFS